MIPYGRQTIDDSDISAVVEVMRGDWLTQGPKIEEFEQALSDITGAKFTIAFSNGTAALHAAAAAAGLGTGDTVITSPLSFVASANCARYVGAQVGFIDIDPLTLNMDLSALPNCDAVVAVHYAGLPLDLSSMQRRPRIVIEDASHALGASTPDGPVGNCAHSDMTTFSFHPVKSITTGEGGAVTTNDASLADALRKFRNHGIVRIPEKGDWYYEVDSIGYNFRLTDIQAALGISQLGKLSAFIERRNELAAQYVNLLSELPIILPPTTPNGFRHAFHLYPVQVDNRDLVYTKMKHGGVGVQVHYIPIHWFAAFQTANYPHGSLPFAELAYSKLLSIPLHPSLTDIQQVEVVQLLSGAM